MSTRPAARLVASLALFGTLAGCGTSGHADPLAGVPRNLVLQARPIGRGPSFHPPATGPVIGPCRSALGTRVGVHVELFAANRVVLVAEGIGTRAPRGFDAGRISSAGCYGQLVTIDPTGLVLVRPGTTPTLAQLFRSWGQPLEPARLVYGGARHARVGVCRWAQRARAAGPGAACQAFRDRARSRPVRSAPRQLHLPSGELTSRSPLPPRGCIFRATCRSVFSAALGSGESRRWR
jgi:hypothetical protein